MPTTQVKLFAFWRYDLFPHALGGKCSAIAPDGKVYIDSYQMWVQPLLLLPVEEGEKLNSKLQELARKHIQGIKSLEHGLINRIRLSVPKQLWSNKTKEWKRLSD